MKTVAVYKLNQKGNNEIVDALVERFPNHHITPDGKHAAFADINPDEVDPILPEMPSQAAVGEQAAINAWISRANSPKPLWLTRGEYDAIWNAGKFGVPPVEVV